MDGAIHLSMTREPDHRIADAVEGERHHRVLARASDGRLIGLGSRSVYAAYFAGERCRIGYLGQLRVAPGRLHPRALREAFARLHADRRDDERGFDLTAIVNDNTAAVRLLERGLPGLPRYRRLCRLQTLIAHTGRVRAAYRRDVRVAATADLDGIVECLTAYRQARDFACVWDRATLTSTTRCPGLSLGDFVVVDGPNGIAACAAVWDQRGFKQVRIDGYAGWLQRSRHLLNLGLGIRGRPRLPRAPQTLALGYLSHVACAPGDPPVIRALAAAALDRARAQGLTHLAVTLAEDDPLLAELKSCLRPYILSSQLYVVDWGADRDGVARALAANAPTIEGALL